MLNVVLFALEAVIVLCGVVLFAWWLHRRLGTRWGTWVWGAISFIGSQVVRTVFLLLLTALLAQARFQPSMQAAFWINVVILSLTAGLFEETARYVVLRWLAKSSRGWNAAVMFGAGHGGAEALLLIVPAMIGNLSVLLSGDQSSAQALRDVAWWTPPLAVWERANAIVYHIAASILIMQAVMRVAGSPVKWWGWAVLYHFISNAVVLPIGQFGGQIAAEVVITGFTVLSLYLIFHFRPHPVAPEMQPSAG